MDKENFQRRSETELIKTIVEGKLAEVATHRYLKEYTSYEVSEVDFDIYPNGVTDDCDLMVNGFTLSIKSSKPNSSCLMMECDRFKEIDKKLIVEGKDAPDFISFVRIESSVRGKEYAIISGVTSFSDFWNNKKFMPRGFKICRKNAYDYLIDNKPLAELDDFVGFGLFAKNYGVHIDSLEEFTIMKG